MLRTSFREHPGVVAYTELFNPDWNRNEPFTMSTPAAKILSSYLYRKYPDCVRAVGVPLHRSGARIGDWPDLWPRLEADTDLSVISLRRNNLLRRYVSFHLMCERARSGLRDRFVAKPRTYDAGELQAEFERAETEIAAFDERFSKHRVFRLSYEQLCAEYSSTLRRVQVFLGVKPRAVQPATTRNAGPPLERLITNFDELAVAFRQTRWGWFFRRCTDLATPLTATASTRVDL